MYYKNHVTKTTQWEKPSGSSAKRQRSEGGPSNAAVSIRCRHILLKHAASRNPISWRGKDPVTRTKEDATSDLGTLVAEIHAAVDQGAR